MFMTEAKHFIAIMENLKVHFMVIFLKKEEVFEQICSASLQGTLGLFAGSGLTKALMENSKHYKAYTWGELLEVCCEEMNVDVGILKNKGSYPEIATKICKQHSINEEIQLSESISLLKSIIAKIVTVYPEKEIQDKFSEYFDKLDFKWIITTNYDKMIETLLPGKALPISPEDSFIKIQNLTPVYHIHGINTNPDSIIITNEDYVSLFRPNDYRQSRLPFLIKESLVLMVGYSFGDLNVITAVDWSENVYTNLIKGYDFPIIQLLYKESPKDKPYYDPSGIIIYEISSISDFFSELLDFYEDYSSAYDEKIESIFQKMDYFTLETDENVSEFINDKSKRIVTIKFIEDLSLEFRFVYPNYISFLKRVIKKLEKEAEPYGAFEAYNRRLIVLLDIINNMSLQYMPTAFFLLLADSLNSLAHYIGDTPGKSYKAYETWSSKKVSIPKDMITALKKYVDTKYWETSRLKELLQGL